MSDTAIFVTRTGTIVQAEMIPSLTGARDIGGAVVPNSGRIVPANRSNGYRPVFKPRVEIS